jgi:hypothetical protein
MAFLNELKKVMARSATKRVSKADVEKCAYVPDLAQRSVMSAAGIGPVPHKDERIIEIIVADTGVYLQST